jgi:hypothetical protein
MMDRNNLVRNETSAQRPSPETSMSANDVDAEYRRLSGPLNMILANGDFHIEEPASETTEERAPVVVVDSSTVSDNGAARAKEVASYADVVFGG